MSTLVRASLRSGLTGLRHEPTAKRIRAVHGGVAVVDSIRAVLLWEPRRVVPSWAVPIADVRAELLVRAGRPGGDDHGDDVDGLGHDMPDVSDRPVLDPSIPFAVHTAEGDPVDLRVHGPADGVLLPAAGFRLSDADLSDYLVLDFKAFDAWLEEDEPNIGHPRDPFHRIDILDSSRHVRVEHEGTVIAESDSPRLLFETLLPVRFYLPLADVVTPLRPSAARSTCAYKGHASYFSPAVGDDVLQDLGWSYLSPLREAERIAGLIAFYDERVDVILDGELRPRPRTPWSRPRS